MEERVLTETRQRAGGVEVSCVWETLLEGVATTIEESGQSTTTKSIRVRQTFAHEFSNLERLPLRSTSRSTIRSRFRTLHQEDVPSSIQLGGTLRHTPR